MSTEDFLTITPPVADRRLFYGADPNQFGDLRLPRGTGPFPVVMNIHGGFWRAKYDLQHAGHLCAALAQEGIATWNVEYRRVGQPGGGWAGTADDIAVSYNFLQQNCDALNIDLKRILVMGHSAGGQLAFWLAANDPSVVRVLSLAGVIDLEAAWNLHLSDDAVTGFLGGTPFEVFENYQSANPIHLPIKEAKQWVIHGTRDIDVPVALAQNYVAAKSNEKVQFICVPDADHYDLINPDSDPWHVVDGIIRESLLG